MLTRTDWIEIHETIHSPVRKRANCSTGAFIVAAAKSGCRYVLTEEGTFIVQNPKTRSSWSMKARNGDKITWMIRNDQPWGLIVNDKIKRF